MTTVDARALPGDPLDAAARFFAETVPQVRSAIGDGADLVIVRFDSAGADHTGWRIAAIRALAREAAPTRINAIAGDDPVAVAHAADYLSHAPGVTGQCLAVDGQGRAVATG